MPVLAHQHAAHIIARQRGLELAQLVGVEFIDLDAVLAPQIPRQAILLRAFGGTIDIEMAEPVDQVLGAGGAYERVQCFEGRADERAQRPCLGADLLRRAGPDKADEPRGDRREIAPAQRQWTEWVEEPPRHIADHSRHRHRGHRRAVETPGIAKGSTAAGLCRLDQKDAVTVALQPARRAHSDHAGADHPDPLSSNRRHLPSVTRAGAILTSPARERRRPPWLQPGAPLATFPAFPDRARRGAGAVERGGLEMRYLLSRSIPWRAGKL